MSKRILPNQFLLFEPELPFYESAKPEADYRRDRIRQRVGVPQATTHPSMSEEAREAKLDRIFNRLNGGGESLTRSRQSRLESLASSLMTDEEAGVV